MSWRDDLNYGLAAFGVQIPSTLNVDGWLASLTDEPAKKTGIVVMASGLLFLHFEKGVNPNVKDITDAMLYTSTCLSVGYADIHPVTKAGKLLGTVLMTYGPALAAKTLDSAQGEKPLQTEILATLKNILAQLEQQSAGGR